MKIPTVTARTALVVITLCAWSRVASAQPRRRHQPDVGTQPAAGTQPATAVQPTDALEAEHIRGIDMRRRHRDAEARDLFVALYARTHEPRVLAWQAGAEGAMGEWVSAEAHLSSALESTTDPWISQLRADLESDLAVFRQHVGLLEVVSNTPRAEVWLAGSRAGTLPLEHPLKVRAGTLAVEVRAEGFVTEVRTVDVPAGMTSLAREAVNLTPLAPRPLALTAAPALPLAQRSVERESTATPPRRILAFVLLGGGALSLAVGVYGVLRYNALVSDFNGDPTCGSAALTSSCQSIYDSGRSAFVLGVTTLSIGGVLAATGVTLLLLPQRSGRRASSALGVGLGPGEVGLSLHGVF